MNDGGALPFFILHSALCTLPFLLPLLEFAQQPQELVRQPRVVQSDLDDRLVVRELPEIGRIEIPAGTEMQRFRPRAALHPLFVAPLLPLFAAPPLRRAKKSRRA